MSGVPQIIFRLAERKAALPLHQVREVVLPGSLIRVPRSGPTVVGAMNVRGRVALILDGGLLLGGAPSRAGAATERILVLDPRRRDLGVWVSEVLQIAKLGEEAEAGSVEAELLDVEQLSQKIVNLFGPPLLSVQDSG